MSRPGIKPCSLFAIFTPGCVGKEVVDFTDSQHTPSKSPAIILDSEDDTDIVITKVKQPPVPIRPPSRQESIASTLDEFMGFYQRLRDTSTHTPHSRNILGISAPAISKRRPLLPTGVIPGTRSPKRSKKATNQVVVNLLDPAASGPSRPPLTLADTKCGICLENIQEPASTVCGHVFCFECIKLAQQSSKQCPLCRTRLNSKQYHRLFL